METSLVLVVNKELLVKSQVLHQVKIELGHNHLWILKAKDKQIIKDKITRIKQKVEILISDTVIKNYQIQVVTDK